MDTALSRRRLLQSVALVGLSACSDEGARARSAPTAPSTTTGAAPTTVATTTTTIDPALVLERRLERATFGVTPALRAEVDAAGGFEPWLDAQLRPDELAAPDGAWRLRAVDARMPELGDLRFDTTEEQRVASRLAVQTITGRTLLGAAWGPDQLRQRMVDLLADLLHVTSSEQPELFGVPDYDRVLRAGAFGRFADLLAATARHPAMLVFLDNGTSRADGGRIPNENYARELMELHTVGVDGGYDEADVVELAHVLSGWSVVRATRTYRFRPDWHDLGPLAAAGDVLGWRPTAPGERAGEEALEHLAHHPATARRLAHQLARRFVSEAIERDHPLVVEAAEVYLGADTALGPVVRHLLLSDHFAGAATLMVRRPIDLVAHVLRTTGAELRLGEGAIDQTLQSLLGLMRVLGQVPYGWPAPDGYPWSSAAWSNAGAMISRWNGMTTLAAAERFGIVVDPAVAGAADRAALVATLCGPAHQVF